MSLGGDEGTSSLINNEITNPINAAQINDTCSTLIAEIRVAIDEVRDVIDEHPIHDVSLDDTKEIIQLLTKYRLDIRKRSATLMTIASDRHMLIESDVTDIFNLIKDFIKTANDIKAKSNLRTSQLEEEKFENELKSMLFAAEDIISHLTQLQSIFDTDPSSCDDQYLLQLKSEIPEREKTHTIADRYERLLKFPLCNSKLSTLIEIIGVQYPKVKSRKAEFTSTVHAVIEKQEEKANHPGKNPNYLKNPRPKGDKESWYYVRSEDMLADIGTRPGTTPNDIHADSKWVNGLPWMMLHQDEMPIKSASEIKISAVEQKEAQAEIHSSLPQTDSHVAVQQTKSKLAEEVNRRLEFSQYLINPNRFRFKKVPFLMTSSQFGDIFTLDHLTIIFRK
eukprot:gene1520-1680_t